ncbi:MAG: HTTM domain-containing protein [Candidatus Riflebacteria bacterium]|nr:HTTM domain-containing protein [Candidatus Riflebacteria bacterium]
MISMPSLPLADPLRGHIGPGLGGAIPEEGAPTRGPQTAAGGSTAVKKLAIRVASIIKRVAIGTGIAIHFFLILNVVTYLYEWINQRESLFLVSVLNDYYGAVTFANRNFGFFAPEVTPDWVLTITLTDRQGRKRPYALRAPNSEMKLKMYAICGHFGETDDTMDLFARSWAARAITDNPGTVRVDVDVQRNNIPTMEEYRMGQRITQVPFYSTTCFRIAVALFCSIEQYAIRNSVLDLYGEHGFVQWIITRTSLYPGLPHLADVVGLLQALGFSADQGVYIVRWVYLLALVGLLVGWHPRLMAAVAWFIHYLWLHAGGGMTYGMDFFTHIALFYCVIMPLGDHLSVRSILGRSAPTPSVAAGLTRRMLQLQLAIVYVSSGLEKAQGIQWWNGEAMWRSLMLPVFNQFDASWLAQVPWLAMVSCWGVLLVETGYGLFIWWPRTRPVCLALVVGMHFSIGLTMGMWLFGSIMIILNLGAFGLDATRDLARIREALSSRWTRRLRWSHGELAGLQSARSVASNP